MSDIYVSNEGLPSAEADGATWETAFEDSSDVDGINDVYISGFHRGGGINGSIQRVIGYNYVHDGDGTGIYEIGARGKNEFTGFFIKNFDIFENTNTAYYYFIYKDGFFYNINSIKFKNNNEGDLLSCNVINVLDIINFRSNKATIIGSVFPVDYIDFKNTVVYNSSIVFNIDPTGIDYLYFLKTEIQFTGGNAADVASIPRFLTKQEAIDAGIDEYLYSVEGKVETEWDSTVASNCFQNSIVDDNENVSYSDIFVDLYNFNLNLVPGCAPENAADDGNNMGANPSGGIYFNFPNDFHSYNNLDSNGDLVDPTQSAEAVSLVKSVNGGTPAIIKQLNISGFENFSSGNLIDAQPGLVYPAFVAGETLVEGYKYHNSASGEDITFNGRTILAGENFIAGTNDTFSDSNGNAKVYQISTERNGRNIKSVKMKVSDVYTTESEFDNLPAYKFEYGIDVKANIDILGEIQAGNADKNYDPNFPSDVYRAYMQLIVEFSPENIPQ